MMTDVKRKINSNKGASITFALLLFLVCAALSAVVLVAATTAAGRMADIADTDQRYYSVTSAAELLRDSLDGHTVSIFYIDGTRRIIDKPMNQVVNSDIGLPDDVIKDEESVDPQAGVADAIDSVSRAFADRYVEAVNSDTPLPKRTLTLESNIPGDPVKVKIDENIDPDGNVILNVYNEGSGKYELLLRFTTEIREGKPPVTKYYNITNAYEITWNFSEMLSSYDDERLMQYYDND